MGRPLLESMMAFSDSPKPNQSTGLPCASAEWSVPPEGHSPDLTDKVVDVWRAFLDRTDTDLRRLEACLTPEEKSRAARFAFPRDRDHFIACRGILRQLLGQYLRRPAGEVALAYESMGKPVLRSGGNDPPICFNLSHSSGIAVYAIAIGREVGIDVEAIRPDANEDKIARRYFSPREFAELDLLPKELRDLGFFLCWTRKEAYVKARGLGMQIPLDSFDVSLTPGQPEQLRSADAARWRLRSIQPSPGHVGALVAEGQEWGIRLFDWVH